MYVLIVQWLVSLPVTQKTRVRFPIETFMAGGVQYELLYSSCHSFTLILSSIIAGNAVVQSITVSTGPVLLHSKVRRSSPRYLTKILILLSFRDFFKA